MGHDEFAGVAEESVELVGVVDEHVARRGAEEELDGGVACGWDGQEVVDVVVGGAEHKAVVDGAVACRQGLLGLEGLEGDGLRLGVGHVDNGGDAAGAGGAALAVEGAGGILGIAAVAEVHVGVDDAGHEDEAFGLYQVESGKWKVESLAFDNLLNHIVIDDYRPLVDTSFVNNGGIVNQGLHSLFFTVFMDDVNIAIISFNSAFAWLKSSSDIMPQALISSSQYRVSSASFRAIDSLLIKSVGLWALRDSRMFAPILVPLFIIWRLTSYSLYVCLMFLARFIMRVAKRKLFV